MPVYYANWGSGQAPDEGRGIGEDRNREAISLPGRKQGRESEGRLLCRAFRMSGPGT